MNTHTMQAVSNTLKISFLLIGLSLISGCTKQANFVSTKTPVELMAMQVKRFEVSKDIAFASTVATFQNEGYKIVSADIQSGFVTAEGPTKESFILFVGNAMDTLKASAFIEKIGKEAQIRLNFVNEQKTSSGYGMEGETSVPIEEPEFYRDIFSKISKAVYLRQSVE